MLKILGKYNIKIFLVYTGKIFYFCFQKMIEKEFSWLCLVIHREKRGTAFYLQQMNVQGKGVLEDSF
jgi:hypothetical protein